MIFLETRIESMYFYKDAREFREDLKSFLDLELIEKCRKKFEDNQNVRFGNAFEVKEIEDESVDEMKKFYYTSTIKFFNEEEANKALNDEDLKLVYKPLNGTHFHKSQRVYEIKDKMFTIGEE